MIHRSVRAQGLASFWGASSFPKLAKLWHPVEDGGIQALLLRC
jgi:hypothetical protein